MNKLAKLDRNYVWHPFTQMRDWLRREPIVIVAGKGPVLRDVAGREYLDANSSIWTNLHGHNHPRINAAIRGQLRKIAHSSALGLANEPASLLAEQLIKSVSRSLNGAADHPTALRRPPRVEDPGRLTSAATPLVGESRQPRLNKVFFSDDGSTAVEVALKLAYEFARRSGMSQSPRFLSVQGAYHGDTVGAVSLGHIDLFHKAYRGLLFPTDKVPAPYCYRCPYNRAKPERADARDYRQCRWECLGVLERKFARQKKKGNPYAAFVVEPLIQGAAGMIPQPPGWLSRASAVARDYGALLVADEVMTAFGRTGVNPGGRTDVRPPLFACQREDVVPDFMALAKGLTGGYLAMAATLTTERVFEAFLGEYHEFKTFFHGHSYTGNQLGAAAALASLELLSSPASIRARERLEGALEDELTSLWVNPHVGDIRRVGLIAGIELVQDWRTREPFDLRRRVGIRVCEALARRGVLTRPIGNVIVLMPPYCTTPLQVRCIVKALEAAIPEVLSARRNR
ncbi:MAG TPA: aminotransferase class III-fold pyridoxal phosphate-dependent enzyme [Verrucomicrobiae bacterium]